MLKTFSGRNPSQNEFELRSFIKLLADVGATSYLEVGARHGDTFHEVMSSLPAGSYGVAVDLPGGLWGTKSSVETLHKVAEDLRSKGYKIDVIIGDSTARPIIDRVRAKGPFSAVLIDGDHTYKGVKKDWANYHKMAPLIALHDIVGTGQEEKVHHKPVEVPIFWEELKNSHDNVFEFIDKDSKMGIGVCNLL